MGIAFIGIDYIVDITHPQGKIARSAQQVISRGVIAQANKALAVARAADWLTVLVKVGFPASYAWHPEKSPLFGKAKQLGALDLSGEGTSFHPELEVTEHDVVIVKPRVSAFYGTLLEPLTRSNNIDTLVIAGVSTAWAVQSAVRDAHDRDYRVLVVEEACAAATAEEHQESIELLATIAEIVTVEELQTLAEGSSDS